jgi:hypothetical protein
MKVAMLEGYTSSPRSVGGIGAIETEGVTPAITPAMDRPASLGANTWGLLFGAGAVVLALWMLFDDDSPQVTFTSGKSYRNRKRG